MPYQQQKLSQLNLSLILLILSHTHGVNAQSEAPKTSSTTTTEETTGSSKPTECNWDASLGDYLSCNKEKFTTTQLVGAGIGVTLVIFALAFGTLWLVRRRRKPVKNKKTKKDLDEEGANVTEEDRDNYDKRSEENEGVGYEEKHPVRRAQVSNVPGVQIADRGPDQARDTQRSISRAVTVEDAESDSNSQPPSLLTVPSYTSRASRIGSPTESRSIRQLYPSNPDPNASPRNSLKPPTRPPRPPSSQWLPGARAGTGQESESQPPMPPPRYDSRPSTSSNLRPTDDRPLSRSPSPSAPRPISKTPNTQLSHQTAPQHSLSDNAQAATQAGHPPTHQSGPQRPPAAIRSASVYSTDTTQTAYNDMPLPVPPTGPGAQGKRPLAARSSSRASLGSNKGPSLVPSVPGEPVPSKRPASAFPLTRAPTSTTNPTSRQSPGQIGPPVGIQAVRQSVSTQSIRLGVRADSVAVSVHEGDPNSVQVETRKSMGPGIALVKQPIVQREESGQ